MADHTGERYGKLVLLHFAGNIDNTALWRAVCDCGNRKTVRLGNVRSGSTTSCGCIRSEQLIARSIKHGMTHSGTYTSWYAMIRRCKKNKDYYDRGIVVCERWENPVDGFQNFVADMGARPPGMSIDRIDTHGNYTPENCRWATREQQARNTRHNVMLTFNGRTMCEAEWAREIGMQPKTLRKRIKDGWSVEDALTRSLRKKAAQEASHSGA